MNLPLAAAYMAVTNEALRRNAETSVIVYETKLTKLINKEIKRIEAQDKKNDYFRDNIKLYENNKKEISDAVSPKYVQIKNRRTARTYHVRAEVCERIRETVKKVNLTIHKSAKDTFQFYQGSKPITSMLTNKNSITEILDHILKG